MNRITGSARALTKRTPYNSSQTTQTATNQQRATQHAASDKQTVARTHCDERSKTPRPKQGARQHAHKQGAQHAHTTTRHSQSQARTDKHTRSPSEQHRALEYKETPQLHPHRVQLRGIPSSPTPQRRHARKPHHPQTGDRAFPTRTQQHRQRPDRR